MDDRLTVAGRPFNYHARDAASLLEAMRAIVPQTLPEWTNYESDADAGVALLQLFAHMGDIISYYVDAAANESFLGTAQTRRSVVEHLRLIGYRLGTAASASTELTVTATTLPVGTFQIQPGDAFETVGVQGSSPVRFEYTGTEALPLTFPKPADDAAADGPVAANERIPVAEGRTIFNEPIGQSDGSSYQRFALTHPGLILRAVSGTEVVLSVTPDEEGRRWRLRDTLAFSGPADPDFTIEVDENDRAVVIFGELAPPDRSAVLATYRIGGGGLGNVGPDTITKVVKADGLKGLGEFAITNPKRAVGGAPREASEHAIAQAPAVFRSLGRAVTAGDYVAIALAHPGVGKVRVGTAGWNRVQLVVAPSGGGDINDVLRADIVRHFEDKRPIGTRIDVVGAKYVPVFIAATVDVQPYFSSQRIAEQVRSALRNVLAFDRVDFGAVLYLSKLFEAIEEIDGVAGVNITEFSRPGAELAVPGNGKLILVADELPRVPQGDELGQRPHPVADPHPSGIEVTTVGGAT